MKSPSPPILSCSLTFLITDFNVIKSRYHGTDNTFAWSTQNCVPIGPDCWGYDAVCWYAAGFIGEVFHGDLKQWLPQEHWNSTWMILNGTSVLTGYVQNYPQGLSKLPCGYAPKYISRTMCNSDLPERTQRPRSEFWLKSFLRGTFVAKKWMNTTEINNPSTNDFSLLFHSTHLFRTYAREH